MDNNYLVLDNIFRSRPKKKHFIFCIVNYVFLLQAHLLNCSLDAVCCTLHCNQRVSRLALDDHVRNACPNRRQMCEYCRTEFSGLEYDVSDIFVNYISLNLVRPSSFMRATPVLNFCFPTKLPSRSDFETKKAHVVALHSRNTIAHNNKTGLYFSIGKVSELFI